MAYKRGRTSLHRDGDMMGKSRGPVCRGEMEIAQDKKTRVLKR